MELISAIDYNHDIIYFYQCPKCQFRQFDDGECTQCRKNKIKDWHEEEAQTGNL
jgi:hypothetical protein